ncbi:unnamed protein product, partial [Meganyctiphanes norvegica]
MCYGVEGVPCSVPVRLWSKSSLCLRLQRIRIMLSLRFLRSFGAAIGNNCNFSEILNRKTQLQLNAACIYKCSVYVKLQSYHILHTNRQDGKLNMYYNGLIRSHHREAYLDLLNKKTPVNLNVTREKHSKRKGKKSRSDDEFTDDDFEDEDIKLKTGSDFKESLIKLDTLRMDSII